MRITILTILIFSIILSLSFSLSTAQILNKRYVNTKIGQGIGFGGKGIAIEYRYNRFGIASQFGYLGKQYIYEHNIKSSFNFGINGRYYYYKKNDSWQPFVGINVGWLNNYYFPEIGEIDYNPVVYGAAAVFGVEIKEEILNVELGISVDPGSIILHSESHPYYDKTWYFLPNIGIGVNLYAIRNALKFRKILKDNTHTTATENNYNNTEKLEINEIVHKILLEEKAINLIENCNNQALITNEKAYFINDTLFLLKQVGLKQFIYIKFQLTNPEKEQFLSISINSNKFNPIVYFINQNINVQNIEELASIIEDCNNYYIANIGLFSIYINNKSLNAKLEQVVFKSQNETISYNSITFCKLNF